MFFGCLMSIESIGTGLHLVLINLCHSYFSSINQSLPAQKFNRGSIITFIYNIKAVFNQQSFAHVGAERQTNYTNIHTYTHTFWKTISVTRRMPTAGQSGHTPG